MKELRDNSTVRNIAASLLFVLSGAMFFLDWWSVSFIFFKTKITPLELGELADQLNAVPTWLRGTAKSSLQAWIIILLIIIWALIAHAVVCRVLQKEYRGVAVPAAVLAAVIAAGCFAEEMGVTITVVPYLALAFAVAGFILAPAEDGSAVRYTPSAEYPHRGGIQGVSGAYKGAAFTIEDGETLIFGRDPAICHVLFDSSNISRAHCTIRYDAAENRYYVKDTSRNGTYYEDGIRMQPQREMPVTAGVRIYLDNPEEMFKLG